MEISEKDTAKERVLAFLELTGDTHPIHREPKNPGEEGNILPGMFYLALSAPCLDRPLNSLALRFKSPVTYPCSFNLTCSDDKGRREIVASQNGIPLYLGRFKFQEEKQSKDQALENTALRKFAEILGIKIEHPNLEKIWITCLIPQKLLEFFRGELGLYIQQTMEFTGNCFDNAEIALSLEYRTGNGKGRGTIKTDYKVRENIVADGRAFLMPPNPQTKTNTQNPKPKAL